MSKLPLLLSVLLGVVACAEENPDKLVASAREYLARNDNKAAVIQLKNALQKDPASGEARFLLGQALLGTHDTSGAIVELHKAQDLKHPDEVVVPVLVKAMLTQGEARKVTEQYAGTVLAQPVATADLKTSLAVAYATQGKAAEANAALNAAFEAVPDHVPALLAKSRLEAGLGHRDEAFALLARALAKAPEDADALQLKGDLLLRLKGDLDGATQAYEGAVRVSRDKFGPIGSLVALALSRNQLDDAKRYIDDMRKDRPGHAQVAFFDAELAFRQGDRKAAKELTQQLQRVAPDNALVLQLAGAIELQEQQLLRAEQLLSKALTIAPNLGGARQLLAQTYLASRQPDKALETLAPLMDDDEPSGHVLSLAASAHLQQGNVEKAEELFSKATEANPEDMRSRTAMALTDLAKGDAGAVADLQGIAASDKGTTADLALINALLRQKKHDDALKAIDDLERKQPDKPMAAMVRGKVLVGRGDAAGARASFEKALKIDPVYFPAAEALALLDLKDKKPEAAQKRYEQILKKEPRNFRALLAIAQVRELAGDDKEEVVGRIAKAVNAAPSEPLPRVLLVNYHLGKKDFKAALQAAQEGVAAVPENADTLDALGRALLAAGDANRAIVTFNQLAAQRPKSALPLLRLADAYVTARDMPAALRTVRRAIEVAPRSLPAQQKAITLEMESGHPKEALALTRTIQTQRADSPIGYLLEGDLHAVAKAWPAAVTAYRTALQKDPSSAIAEKVYVALLASGKPDEAQRLAADWTRDHARDTRFIAFLGSMALARQDLPVAQERFSQVIALQPDNATALNNLAWISWRLKKPDAAQYAEKANKIQPDHPQFLDTWASILADQNQLDRALKLQQKAVELQPGNPGLRLNLAELQVKAGNKPGARKELESLRSLGQKFPQHKRVEALMQQL